LTKARLGGRQKYRPKVAVSTAIFFVYRLAIFWQFFVDKS
jgi:hypothetical protein